MRLRPVNASNEILPVLSSSGPVSGAETVVIRVQDRLKLFAGEKRIL